MKNKLFIVIALLVGLTSINAQAKKDSGKSKQSEVVFFIPNMHGDHCKNIIEKEIPFEKGVKDLIFDLKEQKLKIVYQSEKTTPEKLQKALEKMGYEVKPVEKEESSRKSENRSCCRSK